MSGTREPERRLPCCRFARQNARSACKSTIWNIKKNDYDLSHNYQDCSYTRICAFKRVALTLETLDDEKNPELQLYT